jgi:tRNA/tmRNA/rRNA uracil-C5-methylase (TrmA/RlmC/RlmD family)
MRGFCKLLIFSAGKATPSANTRGPAAQRVYAGRRDDFVRELRRIRPPRTILLVFRRESVCALLSVGKKRFNEHPFPYHQEIELEIATLTNLGVGLARVPLPSTAVSKATDTVSQTIHGEEADLASRRAGGWVVMCAFALPGERVRARVFRNHKNYSEADLVSVLRPSPHRVTAPCAVFGRCGGCQYQNFNYDQQLRWKRQHVEELLAHLGGLTFPVSAVIGSSQEYGYRSKITPHFNPPRELSNPATNPTDEASRFDERHFPIGFLRHGNRFELIDVPRCEIATEAINARLTSVRSETRQRAAEGAFSRGSTLLLRDAVGGVTTDYEAVVTEAVGALKLRFLARDFFQNNPFILPAFTSYVREQAVQSGARFLVDAYCGSGLFALSAAPAFEKVVGIEISATSVNFARENAQANGIANAIFQAGDASAIFAGLTFPAAETVVVIDPPRKGCDPLFLSQLFQYAPRSVVYVSCDPATQMRDLQHFTAQGYTLTAVQPFDLFPQTRHLECVISLQRTASAG